MINVKILYEDKDIIVVVKPPGMPSQSDRSSTLDMVSYLKNYYGKSGNRTQYVAVVHRLDRPVGGVMVYAKSPEAAKRLSMQIKNRDISKYYKAVLTGRLKEPTGCLENYLKKDNKQNMSEITDVSDAQAKIAKLNYHVDAEIEHEGKCYSLVDIELLTGRHHQIRVQMAGAGAGIYGDTKYNSEFKNVKGWFPIGLFSYKLSFEHPINKKKLIFEEIPQGEPFEFFHDNLHNRRPKND